MTTLEGPLQNFVCNSWYIDIDLKNQVSVGFYSVRAALEEKFTQNFYFCLYLLSPMPVKSWVKLRSPQNISGASWGQPVLLWNQFPDQFSRSGKLFLELHRHSLRLEQRIIVTKDQLEPPMTAISNNPSGYVLTHPLSNKQKILTIFTNRSDSGLRTSPCLDASVGTQSPEQRVSLAIFTKRSTFPYFFLTMLRN